MEKRLSLPDVSLEIPLYDYGEETLADLVRSDENVEDEVAGREKKEILERKVAEFRQTLTDKELFIFNYRTMSEEPTTLQQIGFRFRISRERVRQIEHKVLKRFGDSFETELRQLDL
jgi:RNA polymerase sigma-32 factor